MVRILKIAVCAAFLIALCCQANALLYDSGSPPETWTYLPLANADWGQPFTITQSWNITSIATVQSGCGTEDTLYIKLKQGGGTLGSWSTAGWSGTNWGSVSTDITISPGSYTVVFSHASDTGWAIGNPCANGSNGWFDERPYLGDDGIYQQTGPLAMQLGGSVVPEPASLAVVVLLIAGAVRPRRRA